MNQKDPSKSRRTIVFTISTMIFLLVVFAIYLISNLPSLSSWFTMIGEVLAPVLGGLILAYLCNPIMRFIEHHPLRRIKSLRLKRTLSIFLTYLFFILIIALLGVLIIPQLIRSFQELFAKFDNYIANAITYVNQFLSSFTGGNTDGDSLISLDKFNALLTTLGNTFSNLFDNIIQNIASYGSRLVNVITNAILAIFISFYLLSSKEKRSAQIKKITTALFSEKQNKFIYDTAALTNSAFGNFIGAKLLDSLLVGIIEYIAFTIFGIPYAPMLACILGMTNIIPFFGPIIGAIPSGFIVFISEPSKFIPFIIIMLIIQQTDANIIEPRILGNRTGISPLCVIIAISVMGNLFGVVGMILGVPLFAVVITLVQQYLNHRLEAKGLSPNTDDYYAAEAEHDIALAQGKARLSWRYYVDIIRYSFSGKKHHQKRPNKPDYIIYPIDTPIAMPEKETTPIPQSKESEQASDDGSVEDLADSESDNKQTTESSDKEEQ